MRGDILVLDAGDVLASARHLSEARLDGIPAVDLDRAARLARAGLYRTTVALQRLNAAAREQVPGADGGTPTPPASVPSPSRGDIPAGAAPGAC